MLLRILVLVLAILQPIVAYLSGTGDTARLMDNASTPLITPAGYAFSIWGVICAGSVAYALYQLKPARNAELYRRIALPAAFVFAGFGAWLYAAEQDWLWGTVLIFLGMGYGLYRVFGPLVRAERAGKLSFPEKAAVYVPFGLYAGWATVAIFANVAALIKFSGVSDVGMWGTVWQALILIAALGTSLWLIRRTQAATPYTVAILWAFVAVIVGTRESAAPLILTLFAGIATLLILFQYVRTRMRIRLR